MDFLMNLWDLFVDMSFYIVIGLLFTGLLHAFVNKDFILKHIGKKTASSVVKASIFGVPLPLCSCGVVPTAIYLGKNGASKGAVVSFLTSTPQTGVDSIIATYGLMGPLFAAYRAVAAFFSGILAGVITNLFCKKDTTAIGDVESSCGCGSAGCSETPVVETSCGCSHTPVVETSCGCSHTPVVETGCGCSHDHGSPAASSCCSGTVHTTGKRTFWEKIKGACTYAFGDFLDDIAVHFVIGLVIAAVISTVIPEAWLSSITNPILSMGLMLLIGIPMYICSTASIPIAVSLMAIGVSPGAAFVFLFAGPVTNIASLMILGKSLGKKVLAIYIASASVCAILFGLILDAIIVAFELSNVYNTAEGAHEHEMPLYMTIVAILFGVLVIKSIVKRYIGKAKLKAATQK